MTLAELELEIETLAVTDPVPRARARRAVEALFSALERGQLRAAEPVAGRGWRVLTWVKLGILLAFRAGEDRDQRLAPVFHFRDRDLLATWAGGEGADAPRVVPGGTTIRRGARIEPRVVVMPPAFINVGARVGEGSMVDSHVLVGSCAQVGRRVHLSAGAQIGGVLEPVGALPVIVEDDVFVGGGCGVFEGARVERGAVLAPGVVLSRAVAVYDLARRKVHRADDQGVLAIPAGAVVVPGARPASGEFARAHGIQLQTPVIVKYRDERTAVAVALEQALR